MTERQTDPFRLHYLEDLEVRFRASRALAEAALGQVEDPAFFRPWDEAGNSIAILVKHLAGNLRSRWTDFLTTDGEKPDRGRDREFELEPGDSRDALMECWEGGWSRVFETLAAIAPDDLDRVVTIRGEPHTVPQALNRQMLHTAYHVGQIVLLARWATGPGWRTLSIPRGGTERHNREMRTRYGAGAE